MRGALRRALPVVVVVVVAALASLALPALAHGDVAQGEDAPAAPQGSALDDAPPPQPAPDDAPAPDAAAPDAPASEAPGVRGAPASSTNDPALRSKAQAPKPPGNVSVDDLPADRILGGMLSHWGLSMLLGGLPGALAAFALVVPYGVYAVPLFAVLPLVGGLVATPIANLMAGRDGGYVGTVLGFVFAGVPLYLVMGAVGAVPLVDAAVKGEPLPFDGTRAPLSIPAAAVLSGGLLAANAVTTLFGSVIYAAEAIGVE